MDEPRLVSMSTAELRERRRQSKQRAFAWLYGTQEGPRPHEVDVILAIDSELKRRMREDLLALAEGTLSHLFLERTYGAPIHRIRLIANREDNYLEAPVEVG